MSDQEAEQIAEATVAALVSELPLPLDKYSDTSLVREARERTRAAAAAADLSAIAADHAVGIAEEMVHHRWKAADIITKSRSSAASISEQIPSRGTGVRRINVNFSARAYMTLEQLARQSGKSMSEVLRDAIALKAWFEQTRAEGGHVLVERPDGNIREIVSV